MSNRYSPPSNRKLTNALAGIACAGRGCRRGTHESGAVCLFDGGDQECHHAAFRVMVRMNGLVIGVSSLCQTPAP